VKRVALALALAGCGGPGSGTVPVLPTAVTSWCVDIARFSPYITVLVGPTPATLTAIKAAGFDCIRTNYDPRVRSSAWLDTARSAGLGLTLITPYPTAADYADPTAYANLVTAGMRAYPGQTWELVNEPEGIPAAQYVALFANIIPKMRATGVATIISGGVNWGNPDAQTWVKNISPLYPLVDMVGLHPYPPPWDVFPISALPSILASVTAETGKPAAITEWGLAQKMGPPVTGMPLPNPESQLQAAVDMTAMRGIVHGLTPLFSVYEWDNSDDPFATAEGFGIVGTPALAAFTATKI
jgi:hypothetical protein